MHARVTTIQMDPDRIDESVSQLEERDLPTFRRIDGFKGFTLMVNRGSGKVIGVSYWASEEKMATSEEEVAGARERTAATGGATAAPDVERFEVALDTFVP